MAGLGLFDRLPGGLFGPLASSKNHEWYWNLLLRLYDRFFGPEATPPEGDGYIQRSITLEIERYIVDVADWVNEDEGDSPDTPLNVQSNTVYRYLVASGWLREDQIGVRNFVIMPTAVQKFLELLRQFAEEGPQIIGGKVQLIYNQLKEVVLKPATQASGFHEAALQARQLVSILSATTMRVRDAMDLLATQETTAAFIRTFFDDYIGQLYIRDYHELRTENHPLRHRWEIINAALTLRDDPEKRKTMVAYYQVAFRCVTQEEAEEKFEKDVSRFLMFKDIDVHLNRLNSSVDRATSQALANLQYKLRTQGHLDRLISGAIARLTKPESPALPTMGLLPGPLLGESRLPSAARKDGPAVRTAMIRKTMTIEQQATIRLKRAMKMSREVTVSQVADYLNANLTATPTIESDALPINTIHQFCLFVVVSRLALASRNHAIAGHKAHPMLVGLRDFRFECQPGKWTDNPYLQVPKFTVTRHTTGSRYAA
jgi:hypothetical protein